MLIPPEFRATLRATRLAAFSDRLSTVRTPPELVELTQREARETTSFRTAWLIHELPTGELVAVAAPRCPHRVESRPSLLPALRNLLEDARAEPTGALTIPDASLDPRLRTVRDDGLDLRSLALFPMPAARCCVAALVVASTGEEARWIPDDAELAHLLAMVATLGQALVRIRTRHANPEFERMSRWLGERMTEHEKVDWMDVFSASLVHEFTNMLLVISANAQFLRERLGDCDEIGEILLAVRTAGEAIRTVAVHDQRTPLPHPSG